MSLFKKDQYKKERKAFDRRFEKKCLDIMVLTEDNASAGKSGQAKLWTVSMKILAYVNLSNGELVNEKRRLEWLITDEECQTEERVFHLKKESIYKLKVRESKYFIHKYNHQEMPKGKWLMVVDVLERNCHDKRLDLLLKEYKKEVVIHPKECSELLLDKSLERFTGNCCWNSKECHLHLDADEGSETAYEALKTLNILLINQKKCDSEVREYAAKVLTETANEWAEEDDITITKEEFARRLEISEVSISLNNDFELFYNDDDMFWGHVVIVSGNIKDGLTDATIAG